MIQVIKCPSCAAPLECDENLFEKCDFCGSKLKINKKDVVSETNFGFDKLLRQAQKLKKIKNLIQRGRTIQAIHLYKETFNTSLDDATIAVNKLANGQSVVFQTTESPFQKVETFHFGQNNINNKNIARAAKTIGIFTLIPTLIGVLAGIIGLGVAGYAVYQATQKGKNPRSVAQNLFNTDKKSIANEVLRFGGEGVGIGNFKDNRAVAVDAEGRIYSADYTGGRIQVFDKDGKYLTQWFVGKKETPIVSLGASRNGKVYVAQPNNIMSYDGMSGKLLNETKTRFTSDMAITSTGNVILLERDKITIFDEKLKKLSEYSNIAKTAGISGGFTYIAVNGLGEIYAISRNGQDVCKFSADGKFTDRFKIKPTSVNGIAVDSKGRIFISETNKVWIYQVNGQELDSFETKQSFGLIFNEQSELITASRPFVVKYSIN